MTDFLDIRPNSKAQLEFLKNAPFNNETLFGGAAGGGKTWTAVVLPLIYGFHQVTDFAGQIFRSTTQELEQQVIPLTKKYYTLAGGRYNDNKKIWTFSCGAVMQLGYVRFKDDYMRYQGGEFPYQAYDEATNIHENNLEVMRTWNRSKCAVKPFRVFLTNPGGQSHRKFKKDFVDHCPALDDGPMKYSELAGMWWQPVKPSPAFTTEVDVDGIKTTIRRQYIPARVFDNEDLLKRNPEYVKNLLMMPKDKRRKFLNGDWSVVDGQFLDMLMDGVQFIKSFPIPRDWQALASIDYGTTTVAGIMRKSPDKHIYVTDELKMTAEKVTPMARSYRNFLRDNKQSNIITKADTDMFIVRADQDQPLAPADKFKTIVYPDAPWRFMKVKKVGQDGKNYRHYANDVMKDMLNWKKKEDGRWLIKPKLYIFYDKCPYLHESFPLLQTDPDDDRDLEQTGADDHGYDMVKNGVISFRDRISEEAAKREWKERSMKKKAMAKERL